jgi:hypothetical protein
MGHSPPHDGVDTVAFKFVAYLGGRIREVASNYFARADDGPVWYFCEDVADYEGGGLADHDGQLADRQGLAAGRSRPPSPSGRRLLVREPPDPPLGRSTAHGARSRAPPGPWAAMDGTTKDKAFAHGGLDLQLRHWDSGDVDLDCLDLWARQPLVDATQRRPRRRWDVAVLGSSGTASVTPPARPAAAGVRAGLAALPQGGRDKALGGGRRHPRPAERARQGQGMG